MLEPGVLRDQNDVKLLILYILKIAKQPVTMPDITDIIMDGGNANYFDFSDALNQLLSIGHIGQITKENQELLKITPLGIETVEMFEKRLPYSVREKTMRIVIQTLSKLKAESELRCEIKDQIFGCAVTCGIIDMGETLFEVTISVANRMQADIISRRFKENPEYIYKSVINLLTEDLK